MTDQKSRIAKVSERFKPQAERENDQRTPPAKQRKRQSFYLATAITDRLDREYREFNHRAYPHTVGKSVFMEAVLEYGLDNLDTIGELLRERSDTKTGE